MEAIYLSLLTGIFSGLITTVLSVVFYKFYLKIIKPWYTDLLYKGIRLDGKWFGGVNKGTAEIKNTLNLIQKGSDICGTLFAETIHVGFPDKNYSNEYLIQGHIKNNIVLMTYEALSQQRTGVGVFVFSIKNGGREMKGEVIHSEDVSTMWHLDDLVLKRSF